MKKMYHYNKSSIGWKEIEWINLAQASAKWWALVNHGKFPDQLRNYQILKHNTATKRELDL